MDETTLINTFDMINERLYKIENAASKNVENLQAKAIQKQYLPSYLFDYPFDVELDNHSHTSYESQQQPNDYNFLLTYKFKHNIDVYMTGLYHRKNKKEIIQLLPRWFAEEELQELIEVLYDDAVYDDKEKSTYWGLNTHHEYVRDYVTEKYMQTKFPNLLYILYPGLDDYWFVFKTFTNVDEIVGFSRRFLEIFDLHVQDVDKVTIMYESCWTIRLQMWIYFQDVNNNYKYVTDAFINKIPDKEIRKFIDCIQNVCHGIDKLNSKFAREHWYRNFWKFQKQIDDLKKRIKE